jgi:uncharacterized repeat protein (TIGR03803 family)
MSAPGRPFHCASLRFCELVKLALQFVIAVLFMGSASLVNGQSLQTLCSFDFSSGENPIAALTLNNDGNFYGTAFGGSGGAGTIFQMTTNGTLTPLYSFSGTNGSGPNGLSLGNDGNFYGTTYAGGTANFGTVFQVTTNGSLTTLASFNFTNGAYPRSTLTLGNDGNFYGTAPSGGITNSTWTQGMGTIFQVTTNGTLTLLVSFNVTNGAIPEAALTLGNDGNFYGTTASGGNTNAGSRNGLGTVFKVTTNGTLTTLLSFNLTNGATPKAALTLGNDGNFYGTTIGGLNNNWGTVFQVTTNGTLTTLASFNFTDGANPNGLTLGNDGNFYGTTQNGGIKNSTYTDGMGTVFQVTTNGTLTTLASFNTTNGEEPNGLALGNDGNFYGTTQQGGTNNVGNGGEGTAFRLLLVPVISVQPQNQTANAGATATFLCGTVLQQVGFQWQKDGTNVNNGGNILGATNNILTITGVSDTDAASYSVVVSNAKGSVSSSSATLTIIDPPNITAQPTNQLVLFGSNAMFALSINSLVPLRYQWLFNSTNLPNATNANYILPSAGTNNAGNYSVVVSNQAGSVTSSNAALTVVLSPTSRTNYASSAATFTVTAISPESLNYQWQKNGINLTNGGNISGATNSTLTIANISDADAANYSAVVSDAYSSATTSNAILTVNDTLVFATQPLSRTVGAGSAVTFTASVYGVPPFVFQWSLNRTPVGSPSAGTNVSSLTLTDVQTNQAGNYTVQVFNGSGSLISSSAALAVIAQPTLSLQILAGYPVLSVYGTSGNSFMVQYNTNLAGTNWLNLSLINLISNPYQFLDPSAIGEPARFYRAFFAQ